MTSWRIRSALLEFFYKGRRKNSLIFQILSQKQQQQQIDLICKELVLLVLEISIITNLVFR